MRRSVLVLLLVMGMVAAVAPATAMTPNSSIVFWKRVCGNLTILACEERRPGIAVTGTLKEGAFAQKAVFDLGRVSSIAVSRDSLAVYDARTGVLRTGRFRDGLHAMQERYELRLGYDRMVASCDTLLLVDNDTGHALTGLLVDGHLTDRVRFRVPADPYVNGPNPYGWWQLFASCRHGWFQQCDYDPGPTVGLLTGGRWTRQHQHWDQFGVNAAYAATRQRFAIWNSLFEPRSGCDRGLGTRDLETLTYRVGADGLVDPPPNWPDAYVLPFGGQFGTFDRAAGTADSFLLYSDQGQVWRYWVDGFDIVYKGSDIGFTKNWEIIVGGK